MEKYFRYSGAITFRAVFIWVSKIIGFAALRYMIGLEKLAPLSHPIRSDTKTDRDSRARVFPRFASATCNLILIGSLDCLCPLWLLLFRFNDTQLRATLFYLWLRFNFLVKKP